MVTKLRDENAVILMFINNPVFIVDAPRPISCQAMF